MIYICLLNSNSLGYSRRKHREPCRRVISFHLGMRVDRIYEHRIVWDTKLMDKHSEPFGQLSYESIRAVSYYIHVFQLAEYTAED